LKILDLYFIPTRNKGYVLFGPPEILKAFESDSNDRVLRFIGWFVRHPNRLLAWVGRVLRAGHGYYVRLEDRIDPGERVLKGMASAERFVVHFLRNQNGGQIGREFERVLKRQRLKHIFWFSVDLVFCAVVLVFTPFLAPIPGPNVFFYYPFLRLLSHYRAIHGATSGLRSSAIEFKSLPELRGLEENLPGLATFLERMG
jgi:K+-H+ exchange-related protein